MAKKSGKSGAPRKAAASSAAKPKEVLVRPPLHLPNVWQLTKATADVLWRHKRLFIGITLIYGLLTLILVQGLAGSSTDVNSLKTTLNQAYHGHFSDVTSGLSVFVVLVSSGGGSGASQAAGAYQLFIVLLTSLALIWALRQVLSGVTVRIRDTYYRGMYPLVPFMLVLLVVGLQLLPLIIGSAIYATVASNGIATQLIEKLFWLAIFLLLAAVSLYMICSSLFALYIVTLPDMTPIKALRSARELVRHRRWPVLRKILWLPLALLVIAAVIMVPIIIWLTPLAQWLFFLLTICGLAAIHAYMYTLYRELLNE